MTNSRWLFLLFLIGCDTAEAPPPSSSTQALEGAVDERGNGSTQGYATRLRCGRYLFDARSRVYELSYPYSPTMPQALFGDGPVNIDYKPTAGLPFTRHAGNGEVFTGGLGSQGTQMDALGHFGYLDQPWFGDVPFPADQVHYYGGLTQADVKPTPSSPLLRLGIDKATPIVTSALVLDAKRLRGRMLEAGELITAADLDAMLAQADLDRRGILEGDVVYIHTGWGSLWQDPAPNPNFTPYYAQGPGLAMSAQQYLSDHRVVLVGLDNPFTDPLKSCQLDGSCPPTEGTPPFLPFAVHHSNLTQSGIHQIQNVKLDEVAADGTTQGCTMVLPLRMRGAAGSAVRPLLIGAPPR